MADNYLLKDGNEVPRTFRSTDSADIHTPHHIVQSSALPTGAATSALQTTANATLAAIQAATEANPAVTVNHSTTTVGHGATTVTTAGTHVALAGSVSIKWVIVQAHPSNTGWIAIGASGVDAEQVSGTGVMLAAGDSITIQIGNLVNVFVDATVSGEKVRWTYGA